MIENLDIISLLNYSNGDTSNFDGGLENINNSEEIPTLIYDGPFSESTTNKTIKGLDNKVYSESENVSEFINIISGYQPVKILGYIQSILKYKYQLQILQFHNNSDSLPHV